LRPVNARDPPVRATEERGDRSGDVVVTNMGISKGNGVAAPSRKDASRKASLKAKMASVLFKSRSECCSSQAGAGSKNSYAGKEERHR